MADLSPIVKTLRLKATPERAFDHYTNQIQAWWPLASHSLSLENAKSVEFEAISGGRIFEIDKNGREREWGRVKVCEPPHRLVYSWVLEAPEKETKVEVEFQSDGEGGAIMTLTHRGWDKRADGAAARAQYGPGWDGVLALFGESLID